MPARRPAAVVLTLLCPFVAVAGCSSGGGSSDPTTRPGTEAPTTASTTSVATTTTTSTTSTTTTSTTTTSTTTTSTTTTTVPPTTTIPHGAGVVATFPDGSPVPGLVALGARAVYDAAISHDFDALDQLTGGGKRRFRAGFVGQGNAVEAWRAAVDEGRGDPMAQMVRLLEIAPGLRPDGSVVYPYLAVKDPATWDEVDAAVAATLGFTPEAVTHTRRKGRYLDERLTFAPDGTWTGFTIGG